MKQYLQQIVKEAIVPLTKPAGFNKKGLRFLREQGQTTQVIEFQLSRYNTKESCLFYINVGVLFHELFAFEEKSFPKNPNAGYGQMYRRIEDVTTQHAAGEWTVVGESDIPRLSEEISPLFKELIQKMAPISGLESFKDHPWREHVHSSDDCQIAYLIGDYQAARKILERYLAFAEERSGDRYDKDATLEMVKLKNFYYSTK